jgi:hypothetical protein
VSNIQPAPLAATWGSETQFNDVLNERDTTNFKARRTTEALIAPSPKRELLVRSLEETLAGRRDEGRRALSTLVDRLDVDGEPDDMQHLLFAAAVARRLGSEQAEAINLYLRRYEQPQIDLFNLLAERLPLASLAGAIANELLAGFLKGHEEATLLDIGIGTARQEVLLLESMAEAGTLPRRLTIVGVEPGAASLRRAEESLGAAARRLGVSLRFHAINRVAEGLRDADWDFIGSMPGPLVFNSAFSLHHMPLREDGTDSRDEVFQRLALLKPQGVVLCEPNSNHHRLEVHERFENAWRHYGAVFKLLDELDISRQERNAIKMFFGREIEDVVGTTDDTQRYERHEFAGAWLQRLYRNGFTLAEGMERVRPRHASVGVRPSRGSVGVEYRGETIVAVLCGTMAGQ